MAWYAAHIVMRVEFRTGTQEKFPVWENIVLIESKTEDEAKAKAKEIGIAQQGDSGGTFYWEDVPAKWVYCGTRKLITLASPEVGTNIPVSGTEITYSTLEFSSQESLNRFLDCDETQATILD